MSRAPSCDLIERPAADSAAAPAGKVKAATQRLDGNDVGAAMAELSALNRLYPKDTIVPAVMLQRLLKAGRNDEAATLAAANISLARSCDRLALLTLLALERGNMAPTGFALIRDYEQTYPTADIAAAALRLVKAMPSSPECAAIITAVLNSGFEDGRIDSMLGTIRLEQGDRDGAILHFTKAIERGKPNLRVASSLGELHMLKGEAKLALPYLQQSVLMAPKMPSLRVLLGRAYRQLRRFDEAEQQFSEVARLVPGTDRWDRAAIAALSQAGKVEQADEMFQNIVRRREAELPDDFAEGLEKIWDYVDTAEIPQARLDWAWSLRDKSLYGDRKAWERRARWGYFADRLLLNWLECRTVRAEEAMGSLADVDGIVSRMERLHARGKGMIIASAHLGALYAGPLLFELPSFTTKWLASAPSVPSAAYCPTLISTSDQIESQVARQAMMTLAQGDAIALAVDGAMSLSAPRIQFDGQAITYSSFAARMAHRFGAPTLFIIPQWKNGRVDFMCETMPDTVPGEPVDDYLPRWRTSWLSSLRQALSSEPENLRLSGGLWRHVK